MKKLLRLLGGAPLALFLILFSALLVSAATFLEAKTDSHLWAEKLIYKSWVFKTLLSLYFVNILISALRRFPFRKKHIPFLITHLGLLMIISGVFVKVLFGIQGNMTLIEGTASSEITLPNTYALEIAHPSGKKELVELEPKTGFKTGDIEVLEAFPHHTKEYLSWVIGEQVVVSGQKPIDAKEATLDFGEGRTLHVTENMLEVFIDGHKISEKKLEKKLPDSLVVYSGGFAGYATECCIEDRYSYSWDEIRESDKAPLYWSWYFISTLKGKSFEEAKNQKPWSYLLGRSTNLAEAKQEIVGQMWSVSEELVLPEELPDAKKVLLELSDLYVMPIKSELILESPLAVSYKTAKPSLKLEDNHPLLKLKIKNQEVTLGFDGLLWPLKNSTAVRLTKMRKTLPHRVRLKRAETLYYPGTSDPECYLCHAVIDNEKVTLKMNEVHETSDGTRFYLAGIAHEGEERARRVQLVVNRDPAKSFLTYPGAALVAAGIIGLFWGVRRRSY